MTDRAVRLRLDVDIRGDDVGLGALRSGPPGPPVRDGELAVVLGTELARVALAALPDGRRVPVARDLAGLTAGAAAADLAAGRVPGATVQVLRGEEQVGARGWCARAVLAEGLPPAQALMAVDAIRLPPDPIAGEWAARVPWMVPALVRGAVGHSPDALARAVLALRELGRVMGEDPGRAADPATASAAVSVALAAVRPVPGAASFAPPAPAPGDAAVTEPVVRTAAPPVAPPPARPAPPDRRLLAAIAASVGAAVLALVLVFAIIASPGTFGLASASDVNDRVAVIEAGTGQLRSDVAALAREVQSGAGTPAAALRRVEEALDDLEQQVRGLCSVVPVVC